MMTWLSKLSSYEIWIETVKPNPSYWAGTKHWRPPLTTICLYRFYTPLSTMFQLYMYQCVRYQNYWSIYTYTSEPVVMLGAELLAPIKEGHYYYYLKVCYDPAIDRTRDLPHPWRTLYYYTTEAVPNNGTTRSTNNTGIWNRCILISTCAFASESTLFANK